MPDLDAATRSLLDAIAFASRAHHGQLRKDGRTPYASHVFRVSMLVRHVFAIEDPAVLTAAVLHDTIEDTTTDFDDLHERFGEQIAGWVATLSKDKRLQDDRREAEYRAGLAAAPWQVKICKLADICDNLIDSKHLTAEKRARTAARSRGYLQALDAPDLPSTARRAFEIAEAMVREMEGLG